MAEGGLYSKKMEKWKNHNHQVEVECCTAESASLWRRFTQCRKHPGHHQFIAVANFGPGQLPFACRRPCLAQYIKAACRLVVRIRCYYTSGERPPYYPNLNMAGTRNIRLASGFAWIQPTTSEFPCPIPNCTRGPKNHNAYGYIHVRTAKHVIYDSTEALHTYADLYFDHPVYGKQMPELQCVDLDYSLEDTDVAYLKFVTHDPNVCQWLKDDILEVTRAYRGVPHELWESFDQLCVVISHPHGMAKTISIGRHLRFEETNTQSRAHFHTAATCPGSSGGPVLYANTKEKGALPFWVPAVHSYHDKITLENCAFK